MKARNSLIGLGVATALVAGVGAYGHYRLRARRARLRPGNDARLWLGHDGWLRTGYGSMRGYGPGYRHMHGYGHMRGYGPGYGHMRRWGGGYGPGMMQRYGYGPGYGHGMMGW